LIHVIAHIALRPGTREAFLAEFHRIVEPVRAEAGCLEYGPTVDAATEIAAQHRDENLVTIVEKWESVEHLAAHLAAPHMVAYRPKVKDYVVGTTLHVLAAAPAV
jgi:quinol monooxygenase YgiN